MRTKHTANTMNTMRTMLLGSLLCLPLAAQKPKPIPTPSDRAPVPAATTPTVGQPAPTLRLNDHTGKLAAVGGVQKDGAWTVIAFYPKAATPG